MQKKTSQRDSFQKRSGFTSFFVVDKEASKALKLVLDYLWVGKLQPGSRLLEN